MWRRYFHVTTSRTPTSYFSLYSITQYSKKRRKNKKKMKKKQEKNPKIILTSFYLRNHAIFNVLRIYSNETQTPRRREVVSSNPTALEAKKRRPLKKVLQFSIIFYFLVFNFSLLIFYEQRRRSLFWLRRLYKIYTFLR